MGSLAASLRRHSPANVPTITQASADLAETGTFVEAGMRRSETCTACTHTTRACGRELQRVNARRATPRNARHRDVVEARLDHFVDVWVP